MTPAALLAGIRDGNYHAGGICCLQLFRLDESYVARLIDEATSLTRTELGSDVTRANHVTHWTKPRGKVVQFSLFNSSGHLEDFSDDHNMSSAGKRFFKDASYPGLARLASSLPDLVNFRLNLMGPGSSLSPHEEHSLVRIGDGKVGARIRFHLPLVTNIDAELTLEEHVFHLMPGTVYLVNHGCVHSARNGGDTDRLHLVWDMLLTVEAYDAMFGNVDLPLPLRRLRDDEQTVSPLRREKVGLFERIPPNVTRLEADSLALWPR